MCRFSSSERKCVDSGALRVKEGAGRIIPGAWRGLPGPRSISLASFNTESRPNCPFRPPQCNSGWKMRSCPRKPKLHVKRSTEVPNNQSIHPSVRPSVRPSYLSSIHLSIHPIQSNSHRGFKIFLPASWVSEAPPASGKDHRQVALQANSISKSKAYLPQQVNRNVRMPGRCLRNRIPCWHLLGRRAQKLWRREDISTTRNKVRY